MNPQKIKELIVIFNPDVIHNQQHIDDFIIRVKKERDYQLDIQNKNFITRREQNLDDTNKLLKLFKSFQIKYQKHKKSLESYSASPFLSGYKDTVQDFETSLPIITKALELEKQGHTIPKGRPKNTSIDYFILDICATAECLFNLKISNTNNETNRFYQFISLMLNLVRGNELDTSINVAREISPCYDFNELISLVHNYRSYNRLDLYIQHVIRTDHQEDIKEYFESDWSEWDRPDNYCLLDSKT